MGKVSDKLLERTADTAGSSPGSAAGNPAPSKATENGLLEALVFVARHHNVAVSPPEILRGLPASAQGLTLVSLEEAARRIGLKVTIEQRDAGAVPAVTLPAIVCRDGEPAVVLTGLDKKNETARVVVPSISNDERSVSLSQLRGAKISIVVFVTTEGERDTGHAVTAAKRHWFWSAVWRLWPNYAQVVAAALIGNLLGLASPLFIMNVYDRVIPNLAIPTLWVLTGGVVLAFLFDFLLKMLRMRIVDETGRRVDMAVAGRIFDHIMMMKHAYRPASTGAAANQIRDLDSVRDVLTSSTVVAATDFLFIGIFLWVMWILVGPLAYVPAAAVPVVIVATALLQMPLSRALATSQNDVARRQALLVETLTSLESVKVSGSESWLRRSWDRAVAAASRSTTRARFWANFASSFTGLVHQSVSIAIVVWGVFLVLDGQISVGALIAANILAGRVLAPLNNIAQTLARLHHARTALRGLNSLMATETENQSGSRDFVDGGTDAIRFDRLSFSYPDAVAPALEDVSFAIRSGERVGIIGRVGSGKSTAVRLIAGLYEPDTGSLLLNDVDSRQYSMAAQRSRIGLCPQEPALFTGTLRDNILMGSPHASEDNLARIVELSGVADFAANHALGLDMPIQEGGRNLSNGQRQAVSIARILLRSPQVLCLDEPSASMDVTTERNLCRHLEGIAQSGVTLIVATHRDAPLEIVDRLLLFEGGRLLMDGPKDQVIARLKAGATNKTTPDNEP